jgi:hypothetical protein
MTTTKKENKKMTKLVKKDSPKKDKATKPDKKQSATDFLMKHLCDNPDATEEQSQKALEKKGFKRLAESTVYYWVRDMRNIISYLRETGKIIA